MKVKVEMTPIDPVPTVLRNVQETLIVHSRADIALEKFALVKRLEGLEIRSAGG